MSNPFEAPRTEPDNLFWSGQGASFENEIEGIRCTTGFINPGAYEFTPETDEYMVIHDGEISTWSQGQTPKEGFGGEGRSAQAPCFVFEGGRTYLMKVTPKDELFWNDLITKTEVFTYTCFYPETEEQIKIVKELLEAQNYAVTKYMAELRGSVPPTLEQWREFNALPYEAKYGFDV